MRRSRSLGALVLAAALVLLPISFADAVGTGNPVIESPTSGAAHYNGFNGPFVVNLENAPFGNYKYFVDQVPTGGGAPVPVGDPRTQPYDQAHLFSKPQLTVDALSPGNGYAFHITDNAGHETSLAFSVLSSTPPTCSILLPSKVRMKARSSLVKATLSTMCANLHTKEAAWDVRHPIGGFATGFSFSGASTATWRIFDDEYTGVYTVRPASAKSTSNEYVPQNTTRLTMRMDSRINLTATRSGPYVTLRTASIRYSPSANRFKAWSGRRVVLAYRTCSTCAWKPLKVRTTSRYGITAYRFKASKVRQYRATAAGTSTTWAPRADYLSR